MSGLAETENSSCLDKKEWKMKKFSALFYFSQIRDSEMKNHLESFLATYKLISVIDFYPHENHPPLPSFTLMLTIEKVLPNDG